jgi:hypothetical protein
LVYNIHINVCNYANEPMNKHTFGTQSQGLFLACRGEKYTVLVHYYKIYTQNVCYQSVTNLTWNSVPLCKDKNPLPFQSHAASHPFFKPLAPISRPTPLDLPLQSHIPCTHGAPFYKQKTTLAHQSSSLADITKSVLYSALASCTIYIKVGCPLLNLSICLYNPPPPAIVCFSMIT